MAKLIAWLPREEETGHTNSILRAHTVKDSLLVAKHQGRNPVDVQRDHLRRWRAEHRKRLQRWSGDQKYEQRPVASFAERRQEASRKYRKARGSRIEFAVALRKLDHREDLGKSKRNF